MVETGARTVAALPMLILSYKADRALACILHQADWCGMQANRLLKGLFCQ